MTQTGRPGLSQQAREALKLRVESNLSDREIGARLGVNPQEAACLVRDAQRRSRSRRRLPTEIREKRPESYAKAARELAAGSTRRAAAQASGLGERSVDRIANELDREAQPLARELKVAKLEELKNLWGSRAVEALQAMTPEKIAKTSVRDLAWLAGVATDKWQLLRGQPTQRIDVHDRRKLDELAKLVLDEARRRRVEIDVTPRGEVETLPSPHKSAHQREVSEEVYGLSAGEASDYGSS